MRFYIELICKKNEFPIDMRRVVLSIIKSSLTKVADGKYFDKYYEENNVKYKDFCFSVVLPQNSKFLKDKIELSDNTIKVYFSTDDKNKTGLILFNSFLLLKNQKLQLEHDNYCHINSVKQINQALILNNKVVFRTFQGSSIVVRKHDRESNKDTYLTINDPEFINEFLQVAKNQVLIAGFRQKDVDNICIKMLENCKKVVVKNYDVYVDGTIGAFELTATPEIIQYFYDVGIGSKHSQGFGMLNIVLQ